MSVKEGQIIAAAKAKLQENPYPQVQKLSCELRDGMLIINGRVSSFFEKQQAQEAIRCVAGVAGILNAVSVQPAGDHDEGEAG